jgi:KELK-motif containing domain of MRCK Ser/Thr protein kinase
METVIEDLKSKHEKAKGWKETVSEKLAEAIGKLEELRQRRQKDLSEQARQDAQPVLGKSDGKARKIDLSASALEIERQENLIREFRKEERVAEQQELEAKIKLLSQERRDWQEKVSERLEREQSLTKELNEANRDRSVAIGQVDSRSAKIRELTAKLHALRQGQLTITFQFSKRAITGSKADTLRPIWISSLPVMIRNSTKPPSRRATPRTIPRLSVGLRG